MRRLLIILAILTPLLTVSSVDTFGQKLKKKNIVNGVKMQLPVEFTQMLESDMAIRYVSHRKPLALYTSPDRNVGFGFNVATVNWRFNDLELLKKLYKSTVMSMFTKVDMIDEGVKTINGKEYVFLEFTSTVDRIKNYFYVQYIVINDRIFIFHMMCPAHMRKDWAPVAHEMMESVKINPSKLRSLPVEQKEQKEREPKPDPKPDKPGPPKDAEKKEEVPTFR
ncbi:MAG: hypothetical protein ACK4ND_16495 [Cytophagaceae bacterium]